MDIFRALKLKYSRGCHLGHDFVGKKEQPAPVACDDGDQMQEQLMTQYLQSYLVPKLEDPAYIDEEQSEPLDLSLQAVAFQPAYHPESLYCSRLSTSSPPVSPASSHCSDISIPDVDIKIFCQERKRDYHCDKCGKNFASSSNLSRHRQTHKELSPETAKSCPVCKKMYVSSPALSMHILTHNLNHKCNVCGKAFSRPWLLQVSV